MRLINMTCPNCGSQLQIDLDNKQATCQYCGNALLIDDGVQHIQYDNAKKAGYEFEKGRQRAQAEQANRQVSQTATVKYWQQPQQQKKNNTMVWWVLGWIFFFPIPLTILLVRNKTMNPKVKYGIIAGMWIILLLIGLVRNASNNTTANQTAVQSENSTTIEETTDSKDNVETSETNITDKDTSEESISSNPFEDLDAFIDAYNSASEIKISSQEEIDIHDKSGGYYRTEFRLNHYDGAIAYHIVYDDGSSADIIDNADWSTGETVNGSFDRIYVLASSKESLETIFRNTCKVKYPSLSESEIDDAIDEMMHPYNEEEMEYLHNSGSGLVGKASYTFSITEKKSYFEFFLD